MNGEMAIKAIGLHQFGRPEVLGVATKEEPHARPDDNMHGRAAASAVPTSWRRLSIEDEFALSLRMGRAADPAPTPRDGDRPCRNGSWIVDID